MSSSCRALHLRWHKQQNLFTLTLSQAKREGADIQQRFEAREQSEEAATGRLEREQFTEMMAELQSQGRDHVTVKLLAQRFSVPEQVVMSVSYYYSIPAVHNVLVGREDGMEAEWQ